MADGYWILVWDGYGSGLIMVNPRFHMEGFDHNNNPQNWWPCGRNRTDEEVIKKHDLHSNYNHFRIIWTWK